MIGQTISHYRVIEKIGAGGMGVVYRARDQRLDRDVALKVLPQGSHDDLAARERLRREALALSRLNHTNIAHIYDFDTYDGIAFLIMEYVSGETLAKKIVDGPLPEEVVVRIGVQVASALEAAAEVGIVHRDIKPSNIILTSKGDVKVLDFGLAKLFRANEIGLTQSQVDVQEEGAGTLPYMAPEQLKKEPADFRSDIYSLGTVLYETATGRRPFISLNSAVLISEILNKNPDLPREINPNLSAGFETVVLHCLAKDPARRYHGAAELRVALESFNDSHRVFPAAVARKKFGVLSLSLIVAIVLIVVSVAVWRTLKTHPMAEVSRPNQLAVLPLSGTGNDNDTIALGNGMIETLTSRLAQLSKNHLLQVVPASEIRARGVSNLQEATQQFGATLGLELNIERSGTLIRVNYALVDAKQHKQIGGDTITAPASDPFELEDRVADSVVKSLEIELQPQEQRALTAHGTNQPVAYDYYLQGRGYLQEPQKRENVDSAITEFNHALEKDPRYALAYAGLGDAYWRRYELDKGIQSAKQAEAACEKAIALDANQAASHTCLGLVYNGTGKSEEAVSQYRRAVELEPTDDDAVRGLALAFAKLGRVEDAEKTYQDAIRARPQYWMGYNSLGGLYMSKGRYSEAAEMFSHVIALAPDSFRGYSNLGGAYVAMGRYQEAVNAFEESIKIRPTADAYSNLGTALFDLRRFDEAAQNYREATKLNDQNYILWGNLAAAYYYSGKQRTESFRSYQTAISLAKLQLDVNPNDASVLGDIAGYTSMVGRRDEALTYLNKALMQSDTQDPDLLFDAALVHNQLGETDVALTFLKKALAAGYSPATAAEAPALDNLHGNAQFETLLANQPSQ